MSSTAADLLSAALKLSPEEREELAEQLFESLDGPGNENEAITEEEFAAELNRRHEEYLRDPSTGVPWEEVKRRLIED